jgi:hypothetical protein
MLKLFFTIIGIFILLGLRGQADIFQSIRLIDSKTNNPIEDAIVHLPKTGVYKISNVEGYFYLSDTKNIGDSIIISHIGYTSRSLLYDGKIREVKLTPAIHQLQGITILTPKGIMKEALSNEFIFFNSAIVAKAEYAELTSNGAILNQVGAATGYLLSIGKYKFPKIDRTDEWGVLDAAFWERAAMTTALKYQKRRDNGDCDYFRINKLFYFRRLVFEHPFMFNFSYLEKHFTFKQLVDGGRFENYIILEASPISKKHKDKIKYLVDPLSYKIKGVLLQNWVQFNHIKFRDYLIKPNLGKILSSNYLMFFSEIAPNVYSYYRIQCENEYEGFHREMLVFQMTDWVNVNFTYTAPLYKSLDNFAISSEIPSGNNNLFNTSKPLLEQMFLKMGIKMPENIAPQANCDYIKLGGDSTFLIYKSKMLEIIKLKLP